MVQDSYASGYILDVAASNTPCFGHLYEASHKMCRTCPIQYSCRTKFFEFLDRVASTLVKESKPSDPETLRVDVFDEVKCEGCSKIITDTEADYNCRKGFKHVGCKFPEK